jgi:hypothetical protein
MHDPSGRRPESPWEQKLERAVLALESFPKKLDQFMERRGNAWAAALFSPPLAAFGVRWWLMRKQDHPDLGDFLIGAGCLALGVIGTYRTLQRLGVIPGRPLGE